ncbi:MAG: Hint domain-containing protein, partial [Pseudomonadales bacterium]|nr:Hint domain-containing protein [Pseudomonadales bacterium]
VGEASAEVLTAVSTAGLGAVAIRSARVLGTINRVRARCSALASAIPNIPGFSPALMQSIVNRLDTLFAKVLAIVGRRQCFPAGTMVLTNTGPVPIEQVAAGDLVMSRSPRTKAQQYRPVKRILRSRASQMVRVRYTVGDDDDDASDSCAAAPVVHDVVTTCDHPFHVPAYGSFVEAQRLVAGMELSTSNGHHPVIVTDVEPLSTGDRPTMVYNLEVEGDHTYFVGDAGLWVHNSCSAPFENAFALITRIRKTNTDQWSSFVEALEATASPARAARFDAGMPEVCDALMAGMYKEALSLGEAVDLTKVRTVAQLKAFRLSPAGNRLRGHDIDIHHLVPKEYATLLYRIRHGKEPTREWLDSMPGLLVNKHLHRQSTEGVSSFHQLVNTRIANAVDALPSPASPEELRTSILGAIAHTYQEWDPEYGLDFWVVARGWLQANDL